MKPLNVTALTKGLTTPSARFRVRQLINSLETEQILINELPAWVSRYHDRPTWQWPFLASGTFLKRIPDVMQSHQSEVTLLQRELFSTLVTLEPFLKKPIVFDVDDAIFLRRGGKAAARLAQLAEHVVCGNAFIADYFSQYNENITIIPTAVDVHRYTIIEEQAPFELTIGWIGTSSNFPYLYAIESALVAICQQRPSVRIKIIADRAPAFSDPLRAFVDFVPWSMQTEVRDIQSFTVGLMPLDDGEWERGKCSFKMLQYMACGIPVIVSPVGMNCDVLALGEMGFAATTDQEWLEGVLSLLDEPAAARQMGKVGREIVESQFSVEKIAQMLADVFRQVS